MRDPMELRVVIAAGGTGGHLFPGIAVAQEFQDRHQAAVTFLTTPKPVTTQILESYGFAWEAVSARALKGEGLLSRGRTLLGMPGAVLAARARLKNLNPHLVLGMGGHSSGPAGVAAWLLGIPLALHEQNAIPGATNRYLSRLAAKIFVSFPASRDFFPRGRCLWTGNPIRPEFFEPGEPRADSPFTVLITGGSQGAHAPQYGGAGGAAVAGGPERPPGAFSTSPVRPTGRRWPRATGSTALPPRWRPSARRCRI